MQAVDEIARCQPRDAVADWKLQPYFVPFGATREGAHGYKSAKYPSNGPDNTAGGWQNLSFTPVTLVPGTKPREWELNIGTPAEFEQFLLLQSNKGYKPRLLDAACWWQRFAEFNEPLTEVELVERFVSAFALGDAEKQVFETLSEDDEGLVSFAGEIANPSNYLPPGPRITTGADTPIPSSNASVNHPTAHDIRAVIDYVSSQGFVFHPWQVAAFITAARTKPFIILAGISGTGKTKLPRLVAEATEAHFDVIPVQPSWTDSSDLVGYERITGDWVAGRLLRIAREASENPDRQHFVLLDEMNIARVEYYLAEVLSLIEERREEGEVISSAPIAPSAPDEWNDVRIPSNLCIVGSVNMDETTFGFSRKVLDRSFVIEFASVDLTAIGETRTSSLPVPWPVQRWRQQALTLASHPDKASSEVHRVIDALTAVNQALESAQLQVGYRVRDEVAMFCLNAQSCTDCFTTRDESPIDPLDLAVTMKILPRIQGGGNAISSALGTIDAWASGAGTGDDGLTSGNATSFPFTAERAKLMLGRLSDSGFTSYWL
ncbi:MAG: McrB family protein [Dehalococcoidia bacterium]